MNVLPNLFITTSPEDLSDLPSKPFHFQPIAEKDDPEILNLLCNPVRWFLQCQYGGCNCDFRHLAEGNDMEFAPPADWCPEDPEAIEATKAVYDILSEMLAKGYKVDVVDLWVNNSLESIVEIDVSLSKVNRDSFRFFENRKYNLSI